MLKMTYLIKQFVIKGLIYHADWLISLNKKENRRKRENVYASFFYPVIQAAGGPPSSLSLLKIPANLQCIRLYKRGYDLKKTFKVFQNCY